jgi:hypothetical protein
MPLKSWGRPPAGLTARLFLREKESCQRFIFWHFMLSHKNQCRKALVFFFSIDIFLQLLIQVAILGFPVLEK